MYSSKNATHFLRSIVNTPDNYFDNWLDTFFYSYSKINHDYRVHHVFIWCSFYCYVSHHINHIVFLNVFLYQHLHISYVVNDLCNVTRAVILDDAVPMQVNDLSTSCWNNLNQI